jgi:hypothetical protein
MESTFTSSFDCVEYDSKLIKDYNKLLEEFKENKSNFENLCSYFKNYDNTITNRLSFR